MNDTSSGPVPVPPTVPRVGLIGVGRMGGAMAARLLARGFRVSVHDIDSRAEARAVGLGAMACATPAGLAVSSDVVIVAVVDDMQTRAVLFGEHGAVPMLAAGSAVMLCPTVSPELVEQIAAALGQRGIDCLDAPMSGGPARARDGQMSLMLACADPVFERHRLLLSTLSSRVLRVGARPGDGARTKLVNNLLAAINLAGVAEALALAERLGLDMQRTLGVIEQSSGQSWIGSDRMNRLLQGDVEPRAATALLHKDTRLALAAAAEVGFELPVGTQVAALFARACEGEGASLDDASLLSLLRRG